MLIGNPDRFAFLIERIPEWEINGFFNGMMFILINGKIYPKRMRTTTFNCELFDLLDVDSPFNTLPSNEHYFQLPARKLFKTLYNLTFPSDYDSDILNDFTFLVPFHELSDVGYSVFLIFNQDKVRLIIGHEKNFIDEVFIENSEFEMIKKSLVKFCNTIK